ncbi:MAG: hypothetical protein A2Y94_11345 [Caldithrix sp. RBG_13_44_9]|nr:MAG: hypothetical protein A2Y94_11345 [Caldithrix sp. RBG_13_44_9]
MKIAVISDIHGNLVSLDAVLEDIRRENVDQIICLGDAATLGPLPSEVIARLQEYNCRCILGNHDEYLLQPHLIYSYTHEQPIINAVQWCHDRLSDEEIAYLSAFPRTMEIAIDPMITLICFHGSPKSNTDIILSTTSSQQIDELLQPSEKHLYAGGHTHLQMLRQHKGSFLLNPGSVGLPFAEFTAKGPPRILPWAEYALVGCTEGRVEINLKRIPINKKKIRELLTVSDFPPGSWLLQQYQ